ELLARAEGNELHDGRRTVVEVLEGRVDRAVEDVARNQVADLLGRVDADGFFEEGEEVVNEDGERGEVVYVRVRDDYVAHALALGVGRDVRVYAACDARALEGEFARRAVEFGARAPVRKTADGERAIGCAHARADGAEAEVVGLRDESAREVAPEVLAQHAPL